jgi:probable HAF family extracellular repeat protein
VRKTILHVCGFAILMLAQLASSQDYRSTRLPTLGGKHTQPFAINKSGQIVGASDTATPFVGHAFFWSKTTGMQDLGTFGGPDSVALAINDSGQVVGGADTPSSNERAFLWGEASGLQDLGTLGGTSSRASGINNEGEVVGVAMIPTGETHAFIWSAASGMRDLGVIGVPGMINDNEQVIGAYSPGLGLIHAFLWTQSEGRQDLGTLGGSVTIAAAINASGQVVGFSDTPLELPHAFLWNQAEGMEDLGTFGGDISTAAGINNIGQIVGGFKTSSQHGSERAFLWTQAGGARILIDKKSDAKAINTAGQIVGKVYQTATLWTPNMHTTLGSSKNPSQVGELVTFTVTVNSVQGPPPDGETVTLKNGSKVLAKMALSGGTANFSTSSLKPGSHDIRALYAGDVNYSASKSAIVTQVVQ